MHNLHTQLCSVGRLLNFNKPEKSLSSFKFSTFIFSISCIWPSESWLKYIVFPNPSR